VWVDQAIGNDYSYRKEWIRKRIEALASVFGVDILAYSVLSNHLHLILRTRPDVIAAWSDQEVAIRPNRRESWEADRFCCF